MGSTSKQNGPCFYLDERMKDLIIDFVLHAGIIGSMLYLMYFLAFLPGVCIEDPESPNYEYCDK